MGKNKWIFIFSGIIFVIFFTLLLTRSFWQTWIFDYLFPRQQKLEMIKLALDVVNGIITMFSGFNTIFQLYLLIRPRPEKLRQDDTLRPTTVADLLKTHVRPEPEWEWIDRGIVTTRDWRAHTLIVIEGGIKSGKSLEAVELVRRAVREGLCDERHLYDLSEIIFRYLPDEFERVLNASLDSSAPVVLFIGQLPLNCTQEQLAAITKAARAARKRDRGRVVTTLRSDVLQVDGLLQGWLNEQQARRAPMKPLSVEQRALLTERLEARFQFALDAASRALLVERSDGTPYHLLLTFQRLREANPDPARETTAWLERHLAQSARDIWAEIRADLCKQDPAAGAFMHALAVFTLAGVKPHSDFVFALAERKARRARAAAALFQPYGIVMKDGQLDAPDVAVEGMLEPAEARQALWTFLTRHRRWLQNRWLWRFNTQQFEHEVLLFDLGAQYHFMGDFTCSRECLNELIKLNDAVELYWYKLGIVLTDQHQSAEAESAFRRALTLNEKDVYAWEYLGLVLLIQNRIGEAEAACRRALALGEKYVYGWVHLGMVLLLQNRIGESETAYRRALDLDDKNVDAWVYLGIVLSKQNRHDEAEAACRRALDLDKEHVKAWNNLGIVLRKQGRFTESETATRRALDLDEKHEGAWYNLGNVLRKQDRPAEAEEAYRRALDLDGKDAVVWYNLGILLSDQNRPAEAEEAYRRVLDLDGKYAVVWYSLGIVLEKQDRPVEAETAYRRALDLDGKVVATWNNLGILLSDQNRPAEAEAAYRRALDLDEKHVNAWANLGFELRRQAQPARAIEAYEALVGLAPERSYYHACLAALYRREGLEDAAQREFALAEQYLESDDIYNRACVAALMRDWARAFAWLEEALRTGATAGEYVRTDPDWDEARADPRYAALMAQFGGAPPPDDPG